MGFPLEVAVVWAMFTVVTIAVFVTYGRLPPHDLYHVSGSGLTGGASRALVYLNFPVAVAALVRLARDPPARSWAASSMTLTCSSSDETAAAKDRLFKRSFAVERRGDRRAISDLQED